MERTLGKTGARVLPVSLGGEGILRTTGRGREAVPVILEALRLLDDSLRRLRTDYLDLWQMHDLRDLGEVDALTAKGGALEAAARAREEGRIRFVGLTGHHDPQVLIEAMRRFPFDNLLVAINPADPRYRPLIPTAVAEAHRQGMGVVGMKALAAGALLAEAQAPELLRYAAAHADTVIVGCSSVAE